MKHTFIGALTFGVLLAGAGCANVPSTSPNPVPSPVPVSSTTPEPTVSSPAPVEMMTVKIPTYREPTEEEAKEVANMSGCEYREFKEVSLPKTPAILHAALTAMASERFLSVADALSLDQQDPTVKHGPVYEGVTLSNGLAIVRLRGMPSLAGVCDDARVMKPIQDTACQFPTVKSVRVLEDGKQVDYMNQSGLPSKDYVCATQS